MNLFSDIRNLVLASLEILQTNGTLPKELNFSNVTVEPPRDALMEICLQMLQWF